MEIRKPLIKKYPNIEVVFRPNQSVIDIENASVHKLIFEDGSLEEVSFNGTAIDNVSFQASKIGDLKVCDSVIKKMNLVGTSFSQVLLERVEIDNSRLQGTQCVNSDLKDWTFDIDQYPGMPAFLEVEGPSEMSVKNAISLLGLESNKTWAKGERILIQDIYGLDWYEMRF
jgi:hypothetical protein